MQGGASENEIALTAYVLVSLLENHVQNDKARLYLENHLSDVKEDSYALAVVSYALHLANSPRKSEALKMLESLQIVAAGPDFLAILYFSKTFCFIIQTERCIGHHNRKLLLKPQRIQIYTSIKALLQIF